VTGEVVEVNSVLATDPSQINADCYGAGWMLRIKPAAGAALDHLMTKDQYDAQLASDGH
jgi:glycine cleavage system H protein